MKIDSTNWLSHADSGVLSLNSDAICVGKRKVNPHDESTFPKLSPEVVQEISSKVVEGVRFAYVPNIRKIVSDAVKLSPTFSREEINRQVRALEYTSSRQVGEYIAGNYPDFYGDMTGLELYPRTCVGKPPNPVEPHVDYVTQKSLCVSAFTQQLWFKSSQPEFRFYYIEEHMRNNARMFIGHSFPLRYLSEGFLERNDTPQYVLPAHERGGGYLLFWCDRSLAHGLSEQKTRFKRVVNACDMKLIGSDKLVPSSSDSDQIKGNKGELVKVLRDNVAKLVLGKEHHVPELLIHSCEKYS